MGALGGGDDGGWGLIPRSVHYIFRALSRMSEQGWCDVAFVDDQLVQATQAFPGYLADWVPLTIVLSEGMTGEAVESDAIAEAGCLQVEGECAATVGGDELIGFSTDRHGLIELGSPLRIVCLLYTSPSPRD